MPSATLGGRNADLENRNYLLSIVLIKHEDASSRCDTARVKKLRRAIPMLPMGYPRCCTRAAGGACLAIDTAAPPSVNAPIREESIALRRQSRERYHPPTAASTRDRRSVRPIAARHQCHLRCRCRACRLDIERSGRSMATWRSLPPLPDAGRSTGALRPPKPRRSRF